MKRVVALFGLVVVAGLGAGVRPAYADEASTARLTASDVTAGGHGASDCGDFPPDAPGAGRDGWVFQAAARFGSVRLEFDQGDGRSAVVDLGADRSGGSAWAARFFDNGTEFWLSTPAGWTLRSGAAEVAGTSGGGFDLIRTCWGQEPVAAAPRRAAAVPPAAGAGSATQKLVVVIAPTGTRPPSSRPSRPAGSGSPGQAAGSPGRLPKTGEPIAVLVAVAVALIVVGAALRRVRRAGG